jgi:hypothetical protein
MREGVMVVTGAFATHTTMLYNYYVCPVNWKIKKFNYLAVNYFGELKYLGKIISEPIICNLTRSKVKTEKKVNDEITVDLKEFQSLLKEGDFQLLLLEPIIGGCKHLNLEYKGKGPFVGRFDNFKSFENLEEFFKAHQKNISQ